MQSNRIALIVAIILGLVAVVAVHAYVKRVRENYAYMMEGIKVLVATEDLPAGEKIDPGDVAAKQVPRRYVLAQAVLATDVAEVYGAKLSAPVRKGDQVLWSAVGGKLEKGLARLIPDGERAVTISVTDVTSVGSMILPNDHVDVVGTFTVTRPPEAGAILPGTTREQLQTEIATITILQNVTVLAVGNIMGGAVGLPEKVRQSYGTVALSLTPSEAELVVFAQNHGELTLVLRSDEDLSILEEVPRINFDYLVEHVAMVTKERGGRIPGTTFIKGGKVDVK